MKKTLYCPAEFHPAPARPPARLPHSLFCRLLGFVLTLTLIMSLTGSKAGDGASSILAGLTGEGSTSGPGPDPRLGRNVYQPGDDPVVNQDSGFSDAIAGRRTDSDGLDRADAVLQRGLSYGQGAANSFGERTLSGLVDGGRARLNFSIGSDGKLSGEGDALFPLHDSKYTTTYSQVGTRSMWDSRWIGNLGLGQRWFPFATGEGKSEDSGKWMFGYNAFYDYDFTRGHQRGGLGLEAQYDWLKLASNCYFPLSGWKDTQESDPLSELYYYQERPARGWDIRAKGYLPFYRNLALTGGYSRWYGNAVGIFSSDTQEKDPKIWSYGLEYTPVPLISGYVNQSTTEQGRSNTEVGLHLTYYFQMPWEEQIRHSKVAELRTVDGSRHEFVDRENRIILEYQAKNVIEIVWVNQNSAQFYKGIPTNILLRVFRNGQPLRRQAVSMSSPDGFTIARAQPPASHTLLAQASAILTDLFSAPSANAATTTLSKITDDNGEVTFQLTPLHTGASTQYAEVQGYRLALPIVVAGPATSTLSLTPDSPQTYPVGQTVVNSGFTLKENGLPVANTALVLGWSGAGAFGTPPTAVTTDASGHFNLTSLLGLTAGTVTLTASLPSGQTVSCTLTIGAGPLGLAPDINTDYLVGPVVPNVGFTMREGDLPVANRTLSLSWSGTGAFLNPPATATTDANGHFILPFLEGKAIGTVMMTATLPDSRTAICTLNVASGTLYLTVVTAQYYPVGMTVANVQFSLTNHGAPVPGTTVSLSWSGNGAFLNPPATATTDVNGKFSLNLTGLTAGIAVVTATTGGSTSNGCGLIVNQPSIVLTGPASIGSFVGTGKGTAALTASVRDSNSNPVSGATVSWHIVSAANHAAAMASGWGNKKTGLYWDVTPTATTVGALSSELADTTSVTNPAGKAVIDLTDILGERDITVQAAVTINGQLYTATRLTTFGSGPLSVFAGPPSSSQLLWTDAYNYCNGTAYTGNPAAWTTASGYVGAPKMATVAQLRAVAFSTLSLSAYGAAYAAGWPHNVVWSGEASDANSAYQVNLGANIPTGDRFDLLYRTVCDK
ncbi:MAG: inverse autotransporter beta domain-containing protein [Desulfocapsaceae bacterium]|nr:inverse autotransporter beta domain-containing protein [Desulfocapsaceae bacterium]